jgi:hypothetical protein
VVIEAENEVVTDGTSITCDVDLSDPSVVTGAYDVRVTNPDSVLYGELDKGFSVNGPEHPWPNWGGGRYNQRASQYVGYGDEYASRSPKWVYEAPTYGGPRAGCIVANDGTIYICTSGASPSGPNCALHAINPDGSRKWTFEPNNPWISACPALDPEGYVYVAMGTAIWPSTYHDWVYKVDPDSGDDVWSCYLGDEPCYPHVVTVGLDGAVYVYTGSISDSVRLHRVNPDGTHDWTKTWGGIAYSYSYYMGIAVLDNGNLVCSGDTTGKIFCFQPDGDLVWEYQHTSYTYFPPAIGPEGNIYFTSFLDRTLTALDSGGGYKWSKVLMPGSGSIWASPAVDPNTGYIYIGTRTETSTGDYLGHFLCFDADGNEIWHNQYLNTGIDSSAAVDANGDVYVALGNQEWPPPVIHELVKLDGATGDLIWESDDLGYILTGSPSIGADGTVYLPGYDNTHVLFAFGE